MDHFQLESLALYIFARRASQSQESESSRLETTVAAKHWWSGDRERRNGVVCGSTPEDEGSSRSLKNTCHDQPSMSNRNGKGHQ